MKASGIQNKVQVLWDTVENYGNLFRISRRIIISLLQHMVNIAYLWISQDGNGPEYLPKILSNSLEWPFSLFSDQTQ